MKVIRRPWSILWSVTLVLALASCQRSPKNIEQELPSELLDVLPVGQKRPVEVVLSSPRGEMSELDPKQTIVIGFNQPMVPLRPVSTDPKVDFVEIVPRIEGRFRWKGSATLVFEPAEPLPWATRFQVKVKKQGLTSWSRQEMKSDFSFDFTTPTVALKYTLPWEGSSAQGSQDPLYLHFNQPIKAEQLAGFVEVRQSDARGSEVVTPLDLRAYTEEDRKAEAQAAELQEAYELPREEGKVVGETTHCLVATPRKPLLPGCSSQIVLKAGARGSGPVAASQERLLSFTTRPKFALRQLDLKNLNPESGLYLSFTTPVSAAELRKVVTISPPVALPEYDEGDYTTPEPYLGGDLKPNTRYTLTVAGSLKDRYGASLGSDQQWVITTSDYTPQLLGPEGTGVLELLGGKQIPYGIRNLSRLEARHRKLTPAEVVAIQAAPNSLYSSQPYSPPGGFSSSLSMGGSNSRNEVEQRSLKLPGGGLYYLQVDGSDSLSQRSLVAVSDIGVTAKYSPDQCLVYTTSLANAAPVSGVSVQLLDKAGRTLWTGSTDDQGFCQAPGWAQLKLPKTDDYSSPDLWVFVQKGDSQTFCHSQGYNSVGPWAFDIDYLSDPAARRFQALCFSERGVYRPGETVQIKGSVRELNQGDWKLPELRELNYKVFDSRDRELGKGQVPINRFGGFDQSVKLKAGASTGYYRVEYRLPQELEKSLHWDNLVSSLSFQVEAFRPAQFEVTVKSPKTHYIMGEKAQVQFKGWYLFGAPMNERPLEWSARLEPATLIPEGFEGYDFGLSWSGESQDESRSLTSGKHQLDAQGLLEQSVPLESIPYRGSAYLVVEGTASSPNRQRLSGRTSIPVYRGEVQIGLRAAQSFGGAGKPLEFEAVAVRPDGQTQQGVEIQLELLQRQWNSVQKADASGGYRWVSEVKDESVEKSKVRSSTSPVRFQMTPPKAGFYVVRARTRDSKGNDIVSESSFYATGGDYVAWERQEDDVIQLVSDKKTYRPGDTATVLIKSPYEKSRALVTLEREHVLERFVVELEGTAPTVQIPLTSRHLPNVYFSVMLLQGRNPKPNFGPDGQDLSKPGFKIGYLNLPVEASEQKLQVKVTTDREKYTPGDEVVAEVEVTDAKGQPVEAEVCLSVPDQGVLALTDYQLPDWYKGFYGPRPLTVLTCETRMDVIGQRAYGAKGANAGGGGGFEGHNPRQDFRYTAYWNPSLTTSPEGKAQARFKLPDNLTTFKLMAVAQTQQSKFGSAEARFEVAKPLQLQPSTPDFVRVGDRFRGGVVVRNNSKDSLTVKLTASAEGLELGGESTRELKLESGKEKEVLFELSATKVGPAKVEFSAEGSDHQDALSLALDVQQPVSLENVSTSGSTTDSSVAEMVVPEPMAPNSGILRLQLSSSALVGIEQAASHVLNCSYVGLETYLSQLRVELANRQFAGLGLRDESPEIDPQRLERLFEYAVNEKGYSWWGTASQADPYLTAYALETLSKLKKSGVRVDPKLIDIARSYLKDFLNHPKDYAKFSSPAELRVYRCFALYALSLEQFEGLSYFNNLYRSRLDLPQEARCYLLLAGRQMGASEGDLRSLEDDLLQVAKVEANTCYFQDAATRKAGWTFASDNKFTALALGALLESPRGFPLASKCVTWLMESRTRFGDWGDTHDDARVLENLAHYAQDQEKESPDFTATALFDKKEVQRTTFKGRKPGIESSSTPVARSPKELSLAIKKEGKGRLYYEARLAYAAQTEPPARDEGLVVLKKISTLKGDRFPARLTAGETYLVMLTVISPRNRRFVVVQDPIPAGCEVVQTQFETESAEMTRILQAAQSGTSGTFLRFEKYSDRVALFADGLQAGEHTFQYLIRANQPGKFRMPATRAEEMYHPEVFGTTTSRELEIGE